MSKWNIATQPKDEQDKVNVDLAASGVAYKERLNMPVVAEVVAREQPEQLTRLSGAKWGHMAHKTLKQSLSPMASVTGDFLHSAFDLSGGEA